MLLLSLPEGLGYSALNSAVNLAAAGFCQDVSKLTACSSRAQ